MLSPKQLVTDVSSAKQNIVELAQELNLHSTFIGGHPLFGTEKSGFAAAATVTTDGAMFCLSPAAEASEGALVRLIEWLSLLNLRAQVVDAKAHDQVLARTSHVIQFLTIAMGVELSYLADRIGMQQISSLAGPSVKQMGRLMKSPSQMWCEIGGQNKTEVVDALNSLAETLSVLSRAIETDNKPAIKALFDRAREIGIALHGE
jgi:cyclohexadieny/prephenate dehydrogenase